MKWNLDARDVLIAILNEDDQFFLSHREVQFLIKKKKKKKTRITYMEKQLGIIRYLFFSSSLLDTWIDHTYSTTTSFLLN